jgi:hypothetical protein
MGLDMYLYAEQYLRFRDWDEEGKENAKFDELVKLTGLEELVDKERGYISAYAKVQIAYWRKANAIHKYFVDKCADGKDDGQEVDVSRETLVALKDICGQLVQSKDVEQAKKLLPPQSGFFFGGTEIDEWYFQDLEHTQKTLTKILEKAPEGCDFIYRASW